MNSRSRAWLRFVDRCGDFDTPPTLTPKPTLFVARRTTVTLSDESVHGCTVLGRCRTDYAPAGRLQYAHNNNSYEHHTVKVLIDGERKPRYVEWTRLDDSYRRSVKEGA